MNNDSNSQIDHYRVLIGLDWGDVSHAVALLDQSNGLIETTTLAQSPEAVRSWLKELQQRFGGESVAIALETTKGPLINMLVDFAWLTIYPVHPSTSARYRQAFVPSGAKDDGSDALLLLDLLRYHRDKLRPLALDDGDTRRLAGLCELRRRSVDQRTRLTNEMRSLLKSYFPQALQLVGNYLHSPLALDFFKKWPDLVALKASKRATIKAFYYRHNVRRPDAVEKRLDLIAKSQVLTTDPAIVLVATRRLRRLVEMVRLLQEHIEEDERQIATAFKAHPDCGLFSNLPGAGAALAPRLLVGFGADRARYADAAELERYSGVAPVKEKSGGRTWIHWRWSAPCFLRQTLIEWAAQTVFYSSWAKAYYDRQKAGGKGHWAILRALAFKWIRILWKCWQTSTPYDENTYLKSLIKRKSPLVAHAK